jgi:hypothetical protein
MRNSHIIERDTSTSASASAAAAAEPDPSESPAHSHVRLIDSETFRPHLETISQHLLRWITAREEDFSKVGEKIIGKSSGYVATRNARRYMMKFSPSEICATPDFCFLNQIIGEATSALPLFLILQGQAPVIQPVMTTNPDQLMIRSEFIEGFRTLFEINGPFEFPTQS